MVHIVGNLEQMMVIVTKNEHESTRENCDGLAGGTRRIHHKSQKGRACAVSEAIWRGKKFLALNCVIGAPGAVLIVNSDVDSRWLPGERRKVVAPDIGVLAISVRQFTDRLPSQRLPLECYAPDRGLQQPYVVVDVAAAPNVFEPPAVKKYGRFFRV